MKEQFDYKNQAEASESSEQLILQQADRKPPPIEEGEIFDPEKELKEIHKGPKEEQRKKLKEFKEKLAYQKEGLADMQEELIRDIRANPDITEEELFRKTEEYGNQFGFTGEQRLMIQWVAMKYIENHNIVQEFRKRYPDDSELYRAVFGRPPKELVQVIEGPMTLYFRCSNPEDYAFIYRQDFISGKSLISKDIAMANKTGGCKPTLSLIPGLRNSIIVENSGFIRKMFKRQEDFVEWSESTHIHEEQHEIRELFIDASRRKNTFQKMKYARTDNERIHWMRQYFRWVRENYESMAKNEILAHLKEGTAPEKVFKALIQSRESEGIYDYSSKPRESLPGFVGQYFGGKFGRKRFLPSFLDQFLGGKHRRLIQETIKEVFETEYHKIIHQGIDAFLDLRNKGGYSIEQTIAILIKEPLAKWRKVVARLLEAKKQK